jgi:hypothetical protein
MKVCHRNKDVNNAIGRLATGCTTEGSEFEPQWGQEFSLLHVVQPALGSTKPPIQWVAEALSLGVKRPGREANHSPPASAEVKKMWMYGSTPPYIYMA